MKMNTRNRINLITFIMLTLGGPIYCTFKFHLMTDTFPYLSEQFQSWRWYDTLELLAFAAILIYVPDFFASWLRKKLPQPKHNILRYLILLASIILFILTILFTFSLLGPESSDSNEAPLSVYFDFFLICVILVIFAASLVESSYLSEQWKKEALQRERLEREHLKAQFEVLKSQINPHFLFNSFNTLAELIESDQRLATTFVQELANIYRFVLENRANDVVELKDELKLFKSYLFLMQIRFGDNLRIHWNVPDEQTHFGIIPLTSQMLLENAVKHNIISKDKPLNIYIELDENETLVFKNDLQKKKNCEAASTKTGLQNIVNRYKFVADETIDIIETATDFVVKIPLIKIEQL